MGAGFILAINVVVAGLFAGAFALIAIHDRTCAAARWFALAYVLGIANLAIEAVVPSLEHFKPAVLVAGLCFVAALGALNAGLAKKYSVAVPWRLIAAIFIASAATKYAIQDMPRDSLPRMVLYQMPYFTMLAAGAGIVLAARSRRGIDRFLVGTLFFNALHFPAKPLIALALGGMGASAREYLDSSYALFSQSLGAVLSVSTALLLLAILIRDILTSVTERSETDTLSGLLNRRGFEDRAEAALRCMDGARIPVSVVLCDLDHFKAVNDTFGHACGDRVIQAFAACLRDVSDGHLIVGRLGGEEFAVMLPGANLSTARLVAEGTRVSFSGLPVGGGLPEDQRFTASFGVAEMQLGERLTSLMRRADDALYEAKTAGRDCVRLSEGRQRSSPYRRRFGDQPEPVRTAAQPPPERRR